MHKSREAIDAMQNALVNKPCRIQRKRTKGWKMPENTIYVGRPSKWGNPLRLLGEMIYIDAGYRRKILDKWVLVNSYPGASIEEVIFLYKQLWKEDECINYDLEYWRNYLQHNFDLSELKGKNLACFCSLESPCHADVLLRLANL